MLPCMQTVRDGAATQDAPLKVSLVGFGNVCRQVVDKLSEGRARAEGVELVAIGRRATALEGTEDTDTAYRGVPFCGHDEAIERADVVVEAAVPGLVPDLIDKCTRADKTLIIVSAAGLADVADLEQYDRQGRGRIIVANGMIPGLDIIRAARESEIESVNLTSRIKPNSLRGEDYIVREGITLPGPGDPPITVFHGDARTAAREFPRHFNVAVALSLAGVGLDKTVIEVIADASVRGAKHRVRVVSKAVDLDLVSYGYPSQDNPKTSRLVAPSVISTLLDLRRVVRIGS